MQGYAFQFQGDVFTPQGKADIADTAAHNAEVESRELALWNQCPERFAVYIVKTESGYVATTWLGTRLSVGNVRVQRVKHNISRCMESVRFRGTNGATYFGRYGDSQLCRVKKAKNAH